jgi:hypothetical protein
MVVPLAAGPLPLVNIMLSASSSPPRCASGTFSTSMGANIRSRMRAWAAATSASVGSSRPLWRSTMPPFWNRLATAASAFRPTT